MKVQGGLHSEIARGQSGGMTFRGHRSLNVVSRSKSQRLPRDEVRTHFLPRDVANCLWWHRSDRHSELRFEGGLFYYTRIGDDINPVLDYTQASPGRQPMQKSDVLLCNGHDFAEFDGVNDRLLTGVLSPAAVQPVTIYAVMSETDVETGAKAIMNLKSGAYRGLRKSEVVPYNYGINMGVTGWFTPWTGFIPHIWKMVLNTGASELWWSGLKQGPTVSIGTTVIDEIILGCRENFTYFTRFQWWEDCAYKGLVSDKDDKRLLAYFRGRYGDI